MNNCIQWLGALVMLPPKCLRKMAMVSLSISGQLGGQLPLLLIKVYDDVFFSIITYVLLCGYSPFRSDDMNTIIKQTTEAHIEFHERYWKNISETGTSCTPCHFTVSHLQFQPRTSSNPFLTLIQSLDRLPNKHCVTPLVSFYPHQPSCNIHFLQWLTTYEPSTEHDLSTGLRDHFNPRARWRFAINSARAINRFSGQGPRSGRTAGVGWIHDDDSSEEDLGSKNTRKNEGEEGDDPGLSEFVKVTPPAESEDKALTAMPNEETESESEKPPPPYSSVDSSSGSGKAPANQERKPDPGNKQDEPVFTNASVHDEPESTVVAATTDQESDFHVRMPGSFDDSGPPIPGQGSRGGHHYRRLPQPGTGGWANLMKNLGIR